MKTAGIPGQTAHTFDATDLKLLIALQDDARLSNVTLAKRVGLSPSACLARVRALEKNGVIDRYVTLLNPAMMGLGMNVFIHITLERQTETELSAFEAAMRENPDVMECYLMTGDSDYLVRVAVPDLPALEHFIVARLSKTPGVANIRSSFTLKQVKYQTALPLAVEGR
mgnify:FL=1